MAGPKSGLLEIKNIIIIITIICTLPSHSMVLLYSYHNPTSHLLNPVKHHIPSSQPENTLLFPRSHKAPCAFITREASHSFPLLQKITLHIFRSLTNHSIFPPAFKTTNPSYSLLTAFKCPLDPSLQPQKTTLALLIHAPHVPSSHPTALERDWGARELGRVRGRSPHETSSQPLEAEAAARQGWITGKQDSLHGVNRAITFEAQYSARLWASLLPRPRNASLVTVSHRHGCSGRHNAAIIPECLPRLPLSSP